MQTRSALVWLGTGAAALAVLTAAALVRAVRRRPVVNAWYVALGSSFAAGLGLGSRAPGSPVISQRSVAGYPQQLARLLKVPSFTDMTSSGSTVRHVLHGGQMMLGAQVDALGPDTRLITLTAGGNDVGYVSDLVAAAYRRRGGIFGRVVGAWWKGARSLEERDFASLERLLRDTLRAIEQRSPNARIVVVTYPEILPPSGTCAAIGITDSEAALMRAVGARLAKVTRAAAASVGATIVDMAALSIGHDACSVEPWVNGLRPRNGADFHPTLAGAIATAEAIARALR